MLVLESEFRRLGVAQKERKVLGVAMEAVVQALAAKRHARGFNGDGVTNLTR